VVNPETHERSLRFSTGNPDRGQVRSLRNEKEFGAHEFLLCSSARNPAKRAMTRRLGRIESEVREGEPRRHFQRNCALVCLVPGRRLPAGRGDLRLAVLGKPSLKMPWRLTRSVRSRVLRQAVWNRPRFVGA
jgi:hypothetical protein